MIMEIKPIHLIATDELLDELNNRFDCYIFAGRKPSEETRSRDDIYSRWQGDLIQSCGLCSLIEHEIMEEFLED